MVSHVLVILLLQVTTQAAGMACTDVPKGNAYQLFGCATINETVKTARTSYNLVVSTKLFNAVKKKNTSQI